jgi:hypothetical protein
MDEEARGGVRSLRCGGMLTSIHLHSRGPGHSEPIHQRIQEHTHTHDLAQARTRIEVGAREVVWGLASLMWRYVGAGV